MLRIMCVAAFACLLTTAAEARHYKRNSACTETGDVMRPCDTGSESPTFGEGISRKSLRHRHFLPDPTSKEITHHNTARVTRLPPGLQRVMAEGAGRTVNWIKPRAWCGWQMRVWLGVANPAGNLARWWAGYGRDAHGPHVGAIVVWPRGRRHGHVGIITGRTADGRWIVKSGNDGHRVRERPRSVAGAIAFRWPV